MEDPVLGGQPEFLLSWPPSVDCLGLWKGTWGNSVLSAEICAALPLLTTAGGRDDTKAEEGPARGKDGRWP